MNYFWWLIISGVCFAFGEYFSKLYANESSTWKLLAIFLFYNLGVAAWLPALKNKNELAIVGSIWSILSLLATIGIGMILFHERMQAYNYLGLVFSILAIALLSM